MLVREHGLNSPDRLQALNDKNVDDICDVMKKPGGKNANRMPDKGQQVSDKDEENVKLADF